MIDLLVLGEGNVDLVLSGGDVEPAFGQVERLVERRAGDDRLSGAILACGAARLGLRRPSPGSSAWTRSATSCWRGGMRGKYQ